MEKRYDLDDIKTLEGIATHFSRMGDSYACVRLKNMSDSLGDLGIPVRLECLTIMMCKRGSFNCEINFNRHYIRPNTLVVIPPETLFKFEAEDMSRLDFYIIFVSKTFLVDINIDLNALNIRSLIERRNPTMMLADDEMSKLLNYFSLLDANAGVQEITVFSRNVARSLCAALFYQILQFNVTRISQQTDRDTGGKSRRMTYVQDFMRLVHLHYITERSVSFYASKLCISPKYLTLLVKDATGRSPAEWINEFVIVEAKNMLRFSGKNVQQIAYALNFTTQSSFGKYFKHLTGMSPTAYQKS